MAGSDLPVDPLGIYKRSVRDPEASSFTPCAAALGGARRRLRSTGLMARPGIADARDRIKTDQRRNKE
jgi:hypothetical protein